MVHNKEYKERQILVPIDFTPESIHGLKYAYIVASRLKAGITIAHVHQLLFDPVTGSTYDEETIQNNQKRLDEIVVHLGWDHFDETRQVPIQKHFDIGDVRTRMTELAEDPKFIFTIIGSHDESEFVKRIFGSVSLGLSHSTTKPMIIVPPHTKLKFPGKIIVGLTTHLLDEGVFDGFIKFVSENSIRTEFVHVSDDEEIYMNLKKNLEEKLKLYEGVDYTICRIPTERHEIDETLSAYAHKIKADLIVLINTHRHFIESIGHRSVTKHLLFQPVLPVMIIHAPEKEEAGLTDILYDLIKEG